MSAAKRGRQEAVPGAPGETVAPSMTARLLAEFLGTFILVFGGVGTAVFAANFPGGNEGNPLGVGFLGVALAFGLAVLVAIYAFGHISGGHFNPAVTVGLAVGGRIQWRHAGSYMVAQLIGGIAASTVLFAIAAGGPDGFLSAAQDSGFASNGYGELSPGGFSLLSAMLIEIILTAVFLFVIMGVTESRGAKNFAGLAIGLTLVLIHLVSIPVTNTSVNPVRSIAAAVYGGGDYLAQLWLFILAPLLGALVSGLVYRFGLEPRDRRANQAR